MDAQLWQSIADVIKVRIEVNRETAQLYLLYGALALGLLTFTFNLIKDRASFVKSKFVRIGVIGLLLGAVVFFWLSSRISGLNNKYAGILQNFSARQDTTGFKGEMHSIYVNVVPIPQDIWQPKRRLAICLLQKTTKVAKSFGILGAIFYSGSFLYLLNREARSRRASKTRNRRRTRRLT